MENKELFKGLTEEQIKKAKDCKNTEELLELAKNEGIELTDEQLSAVTGGACTSSTPDLGPCPACGSSNFNYTTERIDFSTVKYYCECQNCLERWQVTEH